MAPFIASEYEVKTVFKGSYSLWEALNFAAISFTRSPSVACMACHHWISVLASAGAGTRVTAARRAQAPAADRQRVVVRGMTVLLELVRFTDVPRRQHYRMRMMTGLRARDICASPRQAPGL